MTELLLNLSSQNWKRLIDSAFRYWKDHARSYFIPIFLMLFVGYLPVRLVQFRQTEFLSEMTSTMSPDQMTDFFINTGGLLVALIFNLLVHGLAYFFVCTMLISRLQGEEETWRQALGKTIRLRNMGTLFLFAILILVGYAFCILPGLYLFLFFSLFVPVVVVEERAGWSALSRSMQLLKHNPQKRLATSPAFRLGVTLLVAWGVGAALQSLIMLPLMVYGFLVSVRSAGAANPMLFVASLDYQIMTIVMEVFVLAVQAVYLVLVLTILTFFYFQIKNLREGYDLEILLRRATT